MLRASPLSSHVVMLQRPMATRNIPVNIHDPDPGVKATRMELS